MQASATNGQLTMLGTTPITPADQNRARLGSDAESRAQFALHAAYGLLHAAKECGALDLSHHPALLANFSNVTEELGKPMIPTVINYEQEDQPQ